MKAIAHRPFSLLAAVLVAQFGLCDAGAGQLDYQKRDNRYEGVRARPVSGFDIELLAAQIDFSDSAGELGDQFHARFYLPRPTKVHLVVRELDYRHFYWLDRAAPESPWKPGFGNVFTWPTADVVRHLSGLRISDLGALARLGRETPSATEEVAPVVLYQSQFPAKVGGYVFHFRLRDDANIGGAVYKQAGGDPVAAFERQRRFGGRPFTMEWDANKPPAAEGAYKLVLSGYLLKSNDRISQVVQFYHRPAIR
jgi:hypothetical protein